MTEFGKEKILSFLISLVILGGILLLLAFTYLSFTLPIEDEFDVMGVPVMYGNVQDAYGDTEPLGSDVNYGGNRYVEQYTESGTDFHNEDTSLENVTDVENQESDGALEEIITQEGGEELPIVVSNTKPKEQSTEERKLEEQKKAIERLRLIKEKAEQAAKDKAAEEARKAAENKARIEKQMASTFGASDGQAGGSRGDTQGKGMQGVPTGNASHGATSGIGYNGSYSLNGRTLGKGGLVKPKYNVDDYGKVVVDVVVDPSGKVIEALNGRGTNAVSAQLIDEALKAARATKFNEVNSLGNQKGTITFVFGYE